MRDLALVCGVSVVAWLATADPAAAITPFGKAFEEKYAAAHPEPAFHTAYKKTRCNVCHVKGQKKEICNPYGDELARLIPGNAEARIKEARALGQHEAEEERILQELNAAFEVVEKIKTNPSNTASPTYGELIRAGKLPIPAE